MQEERAAREASEARVLSLERQLAEAKSLAAKQSAAEIAEMASALDSVRSQVQCSAASRCPCLPSCELCISTVTRPW